MLEPLVGHERRLRLLEPGDARSADVQVHDLGSDYRIVLSGVERTHTDAARDCKERARVAAVFIALNLHAPAEKVQPEAVAAPVSAATSEAAPPRAATSRITPPTLRWGLGAFASVGYVPKQQAVGGGGLDVWLQHRLWHVGLRATGLSAERLPVSPRAEGGHAQLLRAPAVLFVGLLWRVSRVELGPSVGLAVDFLTARGRGLAASERIWRVNLGAQVGLDARYFLSERWALAARVDASVYPRAYTLRVEPQGREAHTPRIWLSAQLGVLVRVR